MSGIFGSVTIKGNRITDAVQQTATVGIPIPFGYGKFPVSGNVVGVSELRERVIRRRQGKGGVKTEDYVYNLDYAIGFCEGPIRGYWTIKRNGKVVYSTDPTTPIEDQAYATKWLQKATLYLGTEDQAPDSTLETIYGVGQVSAMKGLAYIVVEDDDVTADAGAVPNYEAVVTATLPEFYVTSKQYPLTDAESVGVSLTPLTGLLRTLLYEREAPEAVSATLTPRMGELRDSILRRQQREAVSSLLTPTGGLLKNALIEGLSRDEAVVSVFTPINGTLRQVLITGFSRDEAVSTTFTPTGGRLQ